MFGAQAEATIYGVGDVAYTKWTTTVDAVGSATATGLKGTQMGGSAIGFKASEDLGNGLKAEFNYELGVLVTDNYGTASTDAAQRFQPNTDLTAPENRQAWIGLSGGFGSVKAGRQYSLAFNNSAAVDPGGVTGVPGYLPSNVMSARQSNSIQYTAPNLVAGLNLSVSKVFGQCGAGDYADTMDNVCDIANAGDSKGISANYSTGGLFVGYVKETTTGAGINLLSGGPSTNDIAEPVAGTQKTLTSLSLSYDFGVAKAIYGSMDAAVGDAKLKSSAYGFSAPILGGSVFYTKSSGSISGANSTTAVTDLQDQSLSGTQMGFNYPMSKRTVVYLHNGNLQLKGDGVTAKATSLGVHHSF